MELSKMLPLLCARQGWSMARLARESKVPKPTLHGWTTGRSANLVQLKQVANALMVPLHELVFGEPDPFESGSKEILRELFTGDLRVSIHKIERKPRTEKPQK